MCSKRKRDPMVAVVEEIYVDISVCAFKVCVLDSGLCLFLYLYMSKVAVYLD